MRFSSIIIISLTFALPARGAENRTFQWLPGWASGLGLNGAPVRVSEDEDALRLFRQLFPQLSACDLGPALATESANIAHRQYPLLIDGVELAHAVFALHTDLDAVVLLNASIPSHLPLETPSFPETSAPSDLFEPERVWFWQDDTLVPAWRGWRIAARERARVIVATPTGMVLDKENVAFEAYAPVFEKSALESETIIQSLEALNSEESLDGEWLTIFGPTVDSDRARIADGVYTYDPDTEPELFDQVQSYFNLMRAMTWFVEEMDWDPGSTPLDVFTHAEPANNARYVPAVGDQPGWIALGAGDGKKYRYFSRDSDVAIHEFAHHVIYRTVKSARGESGVLHEGTADYFAYAINEDPDLGEAVVLPQGPLRTALMTEGRRYDDINQSMTSHYLGQYWAAFLWDLRSEMGGDTDHLVYRALGYLHPASGIGDMLAAMLAVDRELFPEETHACLIFNRALARGFSAQMANFDGSSCGLDLARLAADRNATLEQAVSGKAQWCGVVGKSTRASPLLWMIVPLLIVMSARRRRHEF